MRRRWAGRRQPRTSTSSTPAAPVASTSRANFAALGFRRGSGAHRTGQRCTWPSDRRRALSGQPTGGIVDRTGRYALMQVAPSGDPLSDSARELNDLMEREGRGLERPCPAGRSCSPASRRSRTTSTSAIYGPFPWLVVVRPRAGLRRAHARVPLVAGPAEGGAPVRPLDPRDLRPAVPRVPEGLRREPPRAWTTTSAGSRPGSRCSCSPSCSALDGLRGVPRRAHARAARRRRAQPATRCAVGLASAPADRDDRRADHGRRLRRVRRRADISTQGVRLRPRRRDRHRRAARPLPDRSGDHAGGRRAQLDDAAAARADRQGAPAPRRPRLVRSRTPR